MQGLDGRRVRNMPDKDQRSLTDQVYSILRDDIISWRLKPGHVFVETAIASKLGVSKTPVREALALLSQERLVEVLPRVGYRVVPLYAADIRELFDMRLMAETTAVQLAAERATDTQLQELRELYEGDVPPFKDDLSDIEAFIRHHDDLHLRVAQLASNGRLKRLIYQLLRDWTRMCFSNQDIRSKAFGGEPANCRSICEALAARDVAQAQGFMRNHIEYSRDLILEHLKLGIG